MNVMNVHNKYIHCIIGMVCCLLLTLVAAPLIQAASSDKNYIIDDAGLLSQDEIDNLNKIADKYSTNRDIDIIVLTTNDTQGTNTINYANNYYNSNIANSSTYNKNCVIFIIDMSNKKTSIETYEDAMDRINPKRSNKILDKATPYLSDGDYYNAFKTYINKTNYYLGYKSNVDPDNIFFKLWFQIIISLVIGGIVVGIMVFNSGGRITTNGSTYLDAGNSRITGSYDHYIRTTTTRVKKSSDSNKGGGSGTTGGGSSFSSSGERGF